MENACPSTSSSGSRTLGMDNPDHNCNRARSYAQNETQLALAGIPGLITCNVQRRAVEQCSTLSSPYLPVRASSKQTNVQGQITLGLSSRHEGMQRIDLTHTHRRETSRQDVARILTITSSACCLRVVRVAMSSCWCCWLSHCPGRHSISSSSRVWPLPAAGYTPQ